MDRRPQRKLLYQKIASQIKDLIRDDGLRPGDRLPTEAELAERFSVSRSSVREAIKSLELVGILTVRPKHGCTVRPFDLQALSDHVRFQYQADALSIEDLLEARELLETAVLELAIKRLDGEMFRLVDESVTLMARSAPYGGAWAEADMRFHETLIRAAGNHLLESFVEVLREFFAYLAKSTTGRNRDPEQILGEHKIIRNALGSGDLMMAQTTLRQHLRYYYECSLSN